MSNSSDRAAPESHKSNNFLKEVSRFSSLRAAGRQLAVEIRKDTDRSASIVLGIVLGGVPVAHEVATQIGARFDLVILRRLLAPQGPGSQVCAVNIAGKLVVDEEVRTNVPPSTPLDYFLTDALAELENRERNCRGGRPPIDLNGAEVVVVDCGIRSGSTMKAVIKALRTLKPKTITAAVPVASRDGYAVAASLADETICLAQPEPFGHVGLFYEDFSRPGDDRVAELLEMSNPDGSG